MHVIGCQLDSVWEDKAANYARLEALLEDDRVVPRSMIVLPEMWATGFSLNFQELAEDAGGPTEKFMSALAAQKQCTLLGGVVRRGPDGRGRNECVVFGPDGQLLARYCKIHPFSFAGEDRHFCAGNELASFEWHGFRVTPLVCYDLRFPEIFRHAIQGGAQFFAIVANWPQERDAHWRALLIARAIENQAYVVGINRTGRDPNLRYSGHSLIVDFLGNVVVEAGSRQQLLVTHVDVDGLLEYRASFPALRDMQSCWLGSEADVAQQKRQ